MSKYDNYCTGTLTNRQFALQLEHPATGAGCSFEGDVLYGKRAQESQSQAWLQQTGQGSAARQAPQRHDPHEARPLALGSREGIIPSPSPARTTQVVRAISFGILVQEGDG